MLRTTIDKISSQDLVRDARIAGKIPELIHSVFRRQVIARHAEKIGIKLTDEELQLGADNFRIVNKLESIEATCKWLQARFLSLEDLEQIVAEQLIAEKLAHHLFAERVSHFFQQNLLEYSGAIIYEVVIEDRELGMEIFYSLEEGDISFADIARQYIPDLELKRRGGYLGTVKRKQLRPEISAAVFAAIPPELIQPVVTASGVHLIRVEEIIQPQLDPLLHRQIMMEMFDGWVEQQIALVAVQTPIDID